MRMREGFSSVRLMPISEEAYDLPTAIEMLRAEPPGASRRKRVIELCEKIETERNPDHPAITARDPDDPVIVINSENSILRKRLRSLKPLPKTYSRS